VKFSASLKQCKRADEIETFGVMLYDRLWSLNEAVASRLAVLYRTSGIPDPDVLWWVYQGAVYAIVSSDTVVALKVWHGLKVLATSLPRSKAYVVEAERSDTSLQEEHVTAVFETCLQYGLRLSEQILNLCAVGQQQQRTTRTVEDILDGIITQYIDTLRQCSDTLDNHCQQDYFKDYTARPSPLRRLIDSEEEAKYKSTNIFAGEDDDRTFFLQETSVDPLTRFPTLSLVYLMHPSGSLHGTSGDVTPNYYS